MLLAMANPGGIQTKDTTYTKIFVGGLPYHTTNETLEEFFKQFGDIEEAVVINDRQTGKSKGYGFVTMADRASADRACEEPNPVIDGRKANVNLAYLGAKPRMPQTLPQVPGYPASFLQSQYGLQQFAAYPGAAYMAAAGMVGVGIGGSLPGAGSHAPSHQSHSHSQQPGQGSPTTAALQLALEYPFGYQQAAAASQYALPGYEHAQPAYAPYGVATNYFAGTAYSYAALPPHVAGHLSAQLQQHQQLTERSQLS